MGNWTDISSQFVKTKSWDQCEKFYLGAIYIPGDKATRYDHVTNKRDYSGENAHEIIRDAQKKVEDGIKAFEVSTSEFKNQERIEFENDGFDPNFSPLPDQIDGAQQGSRKNNQVQRRETSKSSCQDVLGYQPKRGDFDQEYDMDAELLLADMEFHDDDTPENIKLKENVLELYTARLDERIRRKKFVIERGLLDLKNIQRTERKYSKEEREIVNKCKIFARF